MPAAQRLGWRAWMLRLPVEFAAAFWGAAMGALIAPVVGFTWGDWTTRDQAEAIAQERAGEAAAVALAPVCADRFRHGPDADVQMRALLRVDPWTRAGLVEKGGWATLPGPTNPARVAAVAKACAALLAPAGCAPRPGGTACAGDRTAMPGPAP